MHNTEITRELFEQQRRPRFGSANPERMQLAFWEWMIRGESESDLGDGSDLAERGFALKSGKLKSSYGPYRARDLFKAQPNREDGPIWTFERYGASRTELPDGRVVCIGGEHEDFYDPDFCIYNDVIVFGPEEQIEIYGYPREVFPPTDFHTATVLADRIIIIGNLGYPNDRHAGHTPVYALSLSGYQISEFKTSGELPGWISKHEARLGADEIITIEGGEAIEENKGGRRYKRNVEDYALDLRSGIWKRLTDRNWRQFSIKQQDGGLFVLDHGVRARDLVPQGFEHISAKEGHREAKFLVRGVPIRVISGVKWIEIVVEGDLPEEILREIPEVFRNRIEILCKKKCVLV
jgi:hypothetical protein